jgi:hypothetical protein
MNKKCFHCKKIKSISEFRKYKNKGKYFYYRSYCNDCVNLRQKKWRDKDGYRQRMVKEQRTRRENNPWTGHLDKARERCNNKNCREYRWYGARGIKCYLTVDEIKTLWFHDKAYLMKKPSIDRIDNKGNYEFANCRFIELSDNVKRRYYERVEI